MILLYIMFFLFLVLFFVYRYFLNLTKSFFMNNKKECLKTPEDFKIVYEKVYFNSLDGIELSGWFIPSKFESDTTIIVTHKDDQTKSDALEWSYEFYNKCNLLYFDFRGCGESKGNFFSYGINEVKDIIGAINFLRNFRESFSKKIILFVSGTIAFCVLKILEDDNVVVFVFNPVDDLSKYIVNKLKKKNFIVFASYFVSKFIDLNFLKDKNFKINKNNVFVFLNKDNFYDFKTIKIRNIDELKDKLSSVISNI